jgi:hypothetical protein
MKKVKLISLILAVFLLCGCNVTYDLKISAGTSNEETIYLYDVEDQNTRELYSSLLTEKTVVDKNDLPKGDYVDIPVGAEFYEKTEYRENGNYGVKFYHSFTDVAYRNSNALSKCVDVMSINSSDNIVRLNFSGFKCFKNYSDLTNVRVNITVDRNVMYSNADMIDGETYIWIINSANYNSKRVTLYYKLNNEGTMLDEYPDIPTSKKEEEEEPPETPPEEEEKPVEPTQKKQNKLTEFASKHPILVLLIAFGGFGLIIGIIVIIKKRKL